MSCVHDSEGARVGALVTDGDAVGNVEGETVGWALGARLGGMESVGVPVAGQQNTVHRVGDDIALRSVNFQEAQDPSTPLRTTLRQPAVPPGLGIRPAVATVACDIGFGCFARALVLDARIREARELRADAPQRG